MHDVDNAGLRVSHSVKKLLDTTMTVRRSQLSLIWRPGQPGPPGWTSSVSWRAAAPVPRGPSCLDGPTFESAHPLACLSCRARRIGSARSVAEAHGYSELPVDCLAEPMCQTRAGESGSWFGIAPNDAQALPTAF